MIYLLAQMAVCLALAALAGGAVGWLLHRARTGNEDEALRETIVRQHHQLRRAETDVAMLTDDFDDLKQRSQTEIESLRHETRRLPTLVQNLDKSQTLVRQLMQQHEAQLREINQQNESLRARLVGHEDREAAFARARSELESARAELVALRAARSEPSEEPIEEALEPAAPPVGAPEIAVPTGIASIDVPPDARAPAPDTSSDALPSAGDVSHDARKPLAATNASVGTRLAAALDFERTGFGLDLGAPVAEARPSGAARSDGALAPTGLGADRVGRDGGPFDANELGGGELDGALDHDRLHDEDDPDGDDPGDDFGEAELDGAELDDDDLDDDDLDGEGFLDDSVELLFEPVDRHDDLQRIFGIGPVTERALNRLGITSYSQLAELDRREVEQIADALQIYPGRIERDDWVGNARRQLEDVLEEL